MFWSTVFLVIIPVTNLENTLISEELNDLFVCIFLGISGALENIHQVLSANGINV